jgi:hypothetical protein
MTRQEQFKKELFELFLKYEVEMSVVEEVGGYAPEVVGINFWSYAKYGGPDGTVADRQQIDLTVGKWENGKE